MVLQWKSNTLDGAAAEFGVFVIHIWPEARVYKDGSRHYEVYIVCNDTVCGEVPASKPFSIFLLKMRGTLQEVEQEVENELFSRQYRLPAGSAILVEEQN